MIRDQEKIAIMQQAIEKGRSAYNKLKPFLYERAQEYAQNAPLSHGVTSPTGAAIHTLSNAFYDPAMQAAKAVGGVAQRKGKEMIARAPHVLAAGHLQTVRPTLGQAGSTAPQSMIAPASRSAPSAAEGGRGDALRGLVYTKRAAAQYPFLYAEALARLARLR